MPWDLIDPESKALKLHGSSFSSSIAPSAFQDNCSTKPSSIDWSEAKLPNREPMHFFLGEPRPLAEKAQKLFSFSEKLTPYPESCELMSYSPSGCLDFSDGLQIIEHFDVDPGLEFPYREISLSCFEGLPKFEFSLSISLAADDAQSSLFSQAFLLEMFNDQSQDAIKVRIKSFLNTNLFVLING